VADRTQGSTSVGELGTDRITAAALSVANRHGVAGARNLAGLVGIEASDCQTQVYEET